MEDLCWTCTNWGGASEYNPERPVVCFGRDLQSIDWEEVRPPIEAAPGRVARYDTEYQRNGTRNLFMICEPKGGWRHVEVTERPHCRGLRAPDAVAGGRGLP